MVNENLTIVKGTVLRYTGNEEELILPKNVVRIAPYAFSGCKTLKKIVTPTKLASIGKGAFFGCDNLVEVTIPGRLFRRVNGGKVFSASADIYFRFYATAGAQSEDDDYSDVYESEEDYRASGIDDVQAFSDEVKSEEIITIVEDLPDGDEEKQSGEDLDPETLQEKMEAIIPEDAKEEELSSMRRHELLNLSDYLIEGNMVVKYIGISNVTQVPDFINKIGENAFANTDVKKVILPDKIDSIGKNAFSWCVNLEEINLPEGLLMIDDCAFADCENLKNIRLPETVKFIGANAFRACSALKEINLPASLNTISRRAFDFCVELEKVVVPEGITKLHEGTFSHCELLRKVTLPAGLTEIGAWAFAECYNLREINFPEGLDSICEVSFFNCRSLVAFDLPKSLKHIGRQAFVGCSSLHLVNLSKKLEKQLKPNKVFHKLENLSLNYYEEQ